MEGICLLIKEGIFKMSIKNKYKVQSVDAWLTHEWLLKKHYAKRIPSIEYSFGLYEGLMLIGVCTFGCPPRVMNNGESIFKEYRVKTFELNRLCVNDGLDKNTLSFFVSNCLKKLPRPSCVVSYAVIIVSDTMGISIKLPIGVMQDLIKYMKKNGS